MTVGIVGCRSWLAPHIEAELVGRGHRVDRIAKGDVPYEDMHHLDAVILIAGRARPTAEDILREERLVAEACAVRHPPRRLVYVSSSAVDRWERGSRPLSRAGEEYVLAKKRCETTICGRPGGARKADGYAIRLPPTFGPGQPLDSDMLVPSAIRARLCRGILELRQPLLPFELVYVGDAARAIVDLVEDRDPLPIRSVRSDLHQPLRVASVLSPGIPTILREGWEWHIVGDPERGQRHLTEVTYPLRDSDLDVTVAWYEQNSMTQIESAGERMRLASADPIGLLPSGKVIDL